MDTHKTPDTSESSAVVGWYAVAGPAADDVVVTASGEIDMLSAPLLGRAVVEAFDRPGAGGLVIDLSAVNFFSSSGISVLAHARELAADQMVSVAVVVSPGSAPDRSLTMMGMGRLLAVYPTRAAALTAIARAATPDDAVQDAGA